MPLFVLLVICCFVIASLCVNTALALPGSGTQQDPWRIQSLADFDEFAADKNYWDDYTRLETDVNLAGRTYSTAVIAPDVDNSVGSIFNGASFKGAFDGNGHKIINLNIDDGGAGNEYLGLFGYIGEATYVRNLGLEGGSISGTGNLIGALVGRCWRGSISNCYSTSYVSGTRWVGGLVGRNNGIVSNSYSTGDVIGYRSVGGLIGENQDFTVSNCYCTGSVSGNLHVGGLVGTNYGGISNCYATGSVTGGGSYVGGLVGWGGGVVFASFWDIETSGRTISDGGTGKTTDEMQTAMTFLAWACCDHVWTINEGVDYPRLWWENKPGEPITIPSDLYGGGSGEPDEPYLIYTAEQLNTIGLFPCDWDKHFKMMADIDLGTLLPPPPPPPLFQASNPNPADGAFSVSTTADLSWTAGLGATSHDVYFGTSSIPPFVCNQMTTIFDPGTMLNGTKYYWRIDEVNDSVTTTGHIWSFTTMMSPPPSPLLTAVIDLSDYSETAFNIIGNANIPFTGVFDGNGHTISNFTFTSTKYFIGLFGYVNDPNAEIKNLGLIDPNVNAGTESGSVGSLVGFLGQGNITSCYVEGGSISGDNYVGGLLGRNGNWDSPGSAITNCYSTSSVSGDDQVGGLVGYNCGTISNCYSNSDVTARSSIGGLVGFNAGSISDCYSTGGVNGVRYLGGLVGENYGSISKSYSTGSVSGTHGVGGLVGWNVFIIDKCYSTSDVNGTSSCIGGLVGINGFIPEDPIPGYIYNSYSTGSVQGNPDIGGLGGGLVGYNEDGYIVRSFWDVQTSGQLESDGGTGLPTAQMQIASTFTDSSWDFITPIWTIDGGNDYPRLWWEFVPVLHAEPEVTLGNNNTISWEPVVSGIEYYAECAEDADFSSITYNSGWITDTNCVFSGLELGKMYWYSVKARNTAGTESQWSNVEFSLQGTLTDAVEIKLTSESLKNENMKKTLLNKIDVAMKMFDEGMDERSLDKIENSLDKLENDILSKIDGCAEMGEPDKNDWIMTCEGQNQIYPLVIETIEYIRSFIVCWPYPPSCCNPIGGC